MTTISPRKNGESNLFIFREFRNFFSANFVLILSRCSEQHDILEHSEQPEELVDWEEQDVPEEGEIDDIDDDDDDEDVQSQRRSVVGGAGAGDDGSDHGGSDHDGSDHVGSDHDGSEQDGSDENIDPDDQAEQDDDDAELRLVAEM